MIIIFINEHVYFLIKNVIHILAMYGSWRENQTNCFGSRDRLLALIGQRKTAENRKEYFKISVKCSINNIFAY